MTEGPDSHAAWAFRAALSQRGSLEGTTVGTSMLPFVWPGVRLPLRPATDDEVRPGDIVVVHRAGCFVAHRAICRLPSGRWRTRGDAFSSLDPTEPGETIVARVDGFALGPGVWALPDSIEAGLRRLVVMGGPAVALPFRALRARLRSARRLVPTRDPR